MRSGLASDGVFQSAAAPALTLRLAPVAALLDQAERAQPVERFSRR